MGRTSCTEPQCLYSTAIPLFPAWAVRPLQSLSVCTRVHFFNTLPKFNGSDISYSSAEDVRTVVYARLKHVHMDYHAQMSCGVEHGTHDSPAHSQLHMCPMFAYDTVYLISSVCKERIFPCDNHTCSVQHLSKQRCRTPQCSQVQADLAGFLIGIQLKACCCAQHLDGGGGVAPLIRNFGTKWR